MKKYYLALYSLFIFGAVNLGDFSGVFPVENVVFAREKDTSKGDDSATSTTLSCSAQTHERFSRAYTVFKESRSDEIFFDYVFYQALNELFFYHGIWVERTGWRLGQTYDEDFLHLRINTLFLLCMT